MEFWYLDLNAIENNLWDSSSYLLQRYVYLAIDSYITRAYAPLFYQTTGYIIIQNKGIGGSNTAPTGHIVI